MAASVSDCDLTLVLTENDIPGAVIDHPENSSVSELKWWLLCRGFEAPSTWRKSKLIEKFVGL